LVLALLVVGPASAQEDDVRVFVRPDRGITDTDPIELFIRVEGTQVATPEVTLPKLTNLRVIGGPNTSTQISSDFRTTTRVVTLGYTLLAEQPGAAEIPAFDIRLGDRVVRSEAIRFDVAKGGSGRPAPPGSDRPADEGRRVDAFLEAKLGTTEAWIGQPVSFSVTLFAGSQVGLDNLEVPSFANFWVEDDEVNPQAESYRTTVGGRQYTAYPLKRSVLIPSAPGEYTIEPFVGQLRARVSDRGFFSFGRTVSAIRKTDPLTIRVKELPSAGRPAEFSGAVGRFDLEVELDEQEAVLDAGVGLRVTVVGEGFLKPIAAPELDPPPDLKVFPPKPSERLMLRDGKMISRKTWEWVLVPLAVGEMTLPEIRFSYFDPLEGEYRVAGGEPLTLAVRRGQGGAGEGPSVTRAGVRVQRTDVAFIKARRGRLREGGSRVHERGWFTLLAALPLVLVPVAVVAGRYRARLLSDRGLARSRKARSRARKRLHSVRRREGQLGSGAFHEEIARALVDFVADRFNLASAGLTYDRIDELLGERGADVELRRRFRSCLESCDFARFVPSAGERGRRTETLDEAVALLDAAEKQL
jgi:hypothetical protein